MKNPQVSFAEMTLLEDDEIPSYRNPISLSDDFLFNLILPSFETSFMGRVFLRFSPSDTLFSCIFLIILYFYSSNSRDLLSERLAKHSSSLVLTQSDLFWSLKSLALVLFDDVRYEIMHGLLIFLQDGGELVDEGWSVVIELLSFVPASMISSDTVFAISKQSTEVVENTRNVIAGSIELTFCLDQDSSAIKWPRNALPVAFSSTKLIIDDFLESLPVVVIKDVIICLSNFSAQMHDVNISLTGNEI